MRLSELIAKTHNVPLDSLVIVMVHEENISDKKDDLDIGFINRWTKLNVLDVNYYSDVKQVVFRVEDLK